MSIYQALGEELRAALKAGKRPENPAQAAIEQSRENAKQVWQAVETALSANGHSDQAENVRALLKEADKPIVSRNQALFDQAAERDLAKGKKQDDGREI